MSKKTVTDHVGRTVTYNFPPQRIISLCPSLTDTLFALGLDEEVVGRTQFCIHPTEKVKDVQRVGGTKQVKMDIIAELAPDLIIAEKEENPQEMVESLADMYPVYVTDVESYEDALRMIRDAGQIIGKKEAAENMVYGIKEVFTNLRPIDDIRVAYFIWQKPYMVSGNHTYIHSLLEKCGFTNVFKEKPGRYPTVTEEEIRAAKPDFIFLSSEPFPFNKTHQETFRELFPDSTTILVDGEMFSWYGVRMLQAVPYFNNLLAEIREKTEA
jgi:iron complex transport system substrate-binding protein